MNKTLKNLSHKKFDATNCWNMMNIKW